jgi:hypothetical protein
MKHTITEVKEKLSCFDTLSLRNNIFTGRSGFFYTMGKSSEGYANKVLQVFPDAKILQHEEIWRPFKGGASVANSSHFCVKFTFEL